MGLRKLLILFSLLIAPIDMARAADATACTQAMAMISDQALTTAVSSHWSDFYNVYKKWAVCDDGAIAESFSDSAAQLFAKHWGGIGQFFAFAAKDDDFEDFALRHIDETDDADDLDRIATNAEKSCPQGKDRFCNAIWGQAKYPDVADWLWGYARNQKSDWGDSIGYYPRYNEYVVGDLSGGGQDAVIVAFTLEGVRGGTDWLRYIAVFLKSPNSKTQQHMKCCIYQIGGKGIADAESVEIKNQEILIKGKAFVEGKDAYCCPSKPMIIRLKLMNGKLVEEKGNGS